MTNIKRVREITIEVEKIKIISNLKKEKSNCQGCSVTSEFIAVSLASQLFRITEEFIAELAKDDLVHLKLSEENEILVCLKSLLAAQDGF
ncbi:MAG: hypothetical protein HC846_08840 [Blastocatellia bacterium]|nr:hypothetical protein [Blastocatellia bacterium]